MTAIMEKYRPLNTDVLTKLADNLLKKLRPALRFILAGVAVFLLRLCDLSFNATSSGSPGQNSTPSKIFFSSLVINHSASIYYISFSIYRSLYFFYLMHAAHKHSAEKTNAVLMRVIALLCIF